MGKKSNRIKPGKTRPVFAPGAVEAQGLTVATRTEAMARILDTAIWLWVMEGDPLPVHVLLMSQYHCLRSVKGTAALEPFPHTLTDETQFYHIYDWLRHVPPGGDKGMVFKDANAGLLFFIVDSFALLFGTTTLYMKAFLAHFMIDLAEQNHRWQRAAFYHLPKGFSLADFSGLRRKTCFRKLAKAFAVEQGGDVHIKSP